MQGMALKFMRPAGFGSRSGLQRWGEAAIKRASSVTTRAKQRVSLSTRMWCLNSAARMDSVVILDI